jgi:hypothetical protein
MVYSPEAYLEFCELDDETPTQEGFLEFINDGIDEDFMNGTGTQDIEYI